MFPALTQASAPQDPSFRLPRCFGLSLLSLLSWAEAVLLVVFTIGLVFDEFGAAGLARQAGTTYPAPLGVVVDVLLFGWAAPAAALTGLALWQDAWGRSGLIGPVKRWAVWLTILFNGLVLPVWGLLIVTVFAPESGLSGHFGFAAVFWAIALATALACRRAAYRGVKWRPLGLLTGALVFLLVVNGMLVHAAAGDLVGSLRQLLKPPGGFPTSICDTQITIDCGASAASKVDHPVAWLPWSRSPGPNDWVSLTVTGDSAVEGIQLAAKVVIVLRSGPQSIVSRRLGHWASVRTIHAAGSRLIYRSDASSSRGTAELDWKKGSVHFSVSILKPNGRVDRARLLALWHRIQYAAPSLGQTRST